MFYIGLYRENMEKNTRPRAVIVGMLHHLVDLYHFCSNYSPRAKNGPDLVVNVLHRLIKGNVKILSETTGPRALIFGM